MKPRFALVPIALVPLLAAVCVAGLSFVAAAADSDGSKIDFNRQIRPLLSQNCFSCHGQDKKHREASLRLDQRDAALAKLDSDAVAIIPGNSAASELYRRIVSTGADTRMPPADSGKKLSAEQIQLIKRWIDQGAEYAKHWSFITPRREPLPQVRDKAWPKNAIDYFTLAQMQQHGLQPTDEATRFALIRRVSLDLRGLPPTPAEVAAFVDDKNPDAYERLVDRMLDDTAYGERWARMWLDLARYADSRGYGSDPLRTNMWRYRDWVIDAFNKNLPFDQFTIQQLAGDLLPNPSLDQRIATAFHRNTMTNTEGGTDDEEFRVAAIKDRVDTTMQVWMGLTMGCSKCHNHKYDPITQREYYQFYAFFNQTADSDKPDEFPTIPAPTAGIQALIAKTDQQVADLKAEVQKLEKQQAAEQQAKPKLKTTGRFVRVELPGNAKILSLAEVQVLSGKDNVAMKGTAKQSSTDYEGAAQLAIDGNTSGEFFKAKSTTHTKTETAPWWEVDLGTAKQIDSVVIWNRTDGSVGTRLANFRVTILDADRKSVWQTDVAKHPNPQTALTPKELGPLAKQIVAAKAEITKLEKSKPTTPTLPVLQELAADKRRETYIMVRGSFLAKGEVVQPAILQNFNSLPSDAPANRLGVAQWLVDANNPLTARVTVNRFWAQLFGAGIVETEEDFGTQGEPPSHPQLLDWLATEFIREGWDMKKLLKLIVTSATYRQSSRVTADRLERDPRNRLLSRGPRFRLEAEMVRDQALALSGLLSRKTHGPSVYPFQPKGLWRAAFNGQRTWPTSKGDDRFRRGLYTFWRRTVPYPSMATFDAPSREICTIRRIRTNTPLQAFVTLNDPVYVEAAQALARRIVTAGGASVEDRIKFALELCLARPAHPRQIAGLADLYRTELEHYGKDLAAATQIASDPIGPLPDGMKPAELAAWTVISNVLLNLDGVITKS